MLRAVLAALLGAISGAALAAFLVWLTSFVVDRMTAPEVYKLDHWVIYLCVTLGAGFGCVAGAVIGVGAQARQRGS